MENDETGSWSSEIVHHFREIWKMAVWIFKGHSFFPLPSILRCITRPCFSLVVYKLFCELYNIWRNVNSYRIMQVHFVKILSITYHSLSPSLAVDITYFPKSIYMEIRIQWLRKWFPLFGVLEKILLFGFFVHALYVAHIILLDLFNKWIFHLSAPSSC
jgi:hypothetical protein